ncbi:hypothetical protein NQZ68_037715 [Dissostichus eleginoides]|nr:hypothetical protein NQZ68_037715 [Dissostichus eleginoides]
MGMLGVRSHGQEGVTRACHREEHLETPRSILVQNPSFRPGSETLAASWFRTPRSVLVQNPSFRPGSEPLTLFSFTESSLLHSFITRSL